LFEFLRGKQRRSESRKVQADNIFQRFSLGHGPIEQVFGSPFLIVAGTLGSPTQNMIIQNLVEKLRDEWKKVYFVECMWKKDTEVVAADIEKYHLVLVGDKESNSLISRMADHLPLRASGRSIDLEGRVFDGDQLGYIYISPNPLNLLKQVVVIGMNQWSVANKWQFYLPRVGVCDYFVFDLQGANPRLRDAGYFDDLWRRTNEIVHTSIPPH